MAHPDDTTREIPLHGMGGDYVALVDADDYDALIGFRWFASRFRSGSYAQRSARHEDGRKTTVKMHRQILGALPGQQVDHISGDRFDNRRANLRIVTNQQNQWNRGIDRDNTSGYKGVYWNKSANKWQAYIRLDNKSRYLGVYTDIIEAAMAYDAAARKTFGIYARTNFPMLDGAPTDD